MTQNGQTHSKNSSTEGTLYNIEERKTLVKRFDDKNKYDFT